MDELTVGILVTVGLLFAVFLGVRVFVAAAIAGLVGLVAMIGWDAGAGIVGTIPHSKSANYVLSVLPMFISDRLYRLPRRLDPFTVQCSKSMGRLGSRRSRGCKCFCDGWLCRSLRRIDSDSSGVLPRRHPLHA